MDNSDFCSHPKGGTLAFDIQLLKVLDPREVALVGISTDSSIPVGSWTKITINGTLFDFFPIYRDRNNSKRPLIPRRLLTFLSLLWYLPRVRKKPYRCVFTGTPQFLFALSPFKWNSICFCFAGVENSVALSRYTFLRRLGKLYEKLLFKILKSKVEVVLAAADKEAIAKMVLRSNGVLSDVKIESFPTRYDSAIFKPMDSVSIKKDLGLPMDKKIIVAVGRLSWVKGWPLMLETMLKLDDPDYLLLLVGDGEDRQRIEDSAAALMKQDRLRITGFVSHDQVAQYINAADLVIVASYVEGWSTAMIEAIACGKPIVSTAVSGASALIRNGENGFVLEERCPVLFSEMIIRGMQLPQSKEVSLEIAKQYALKTLKNDLKAYWPATDQILT